MAGASGAFSSSPRHMEVDGIHRVYDGTPETVPKKKLLVTNQDAASLAANEVLITHRKIGSDEEKRLALSEIFSPEIVIIVEAIFLLQEEFDMEYLSLSDTREFSSFVSLLLKGVPIEEKPSFSRFCFGLWHTIRQEAISTPIPVEKEKAKSKRVLVAIDEKKASKQHFAIATGVKLFMAVGEAVAVNNPGNSDLVNVCKFHLDNLCAWVDLYEKKQDRHIASLPFKFICGNVNKALKELAVLEYVKDSKEYELLSPLIKAAIPQVQKAIKEREVGNILLREQRDMDESSMRSHFLTHFSGIMQELEIMEI